MGSINTLGSIEGMIGNLGGMWMYKFSKDTTLNRNDEYVRGRQSILQGGSLPFVLIAVLMAISAILIWRLEELMHAVAANNEDTDGESTVVCDGDVESSRPAGNAGNAGDGMEGSLGNSEEERPDGCCLALWETTNDLKLD